MALIFPLDLNTRLDKKFPCVQFEIVKFKERTLLKDFLDQSSLLDIQDEQDRNVLLLDILNNPDPNKVPDSISNIYKREQQNKVLKSGDGLEHIQNLFLPLPQQLQNNYTPNWEMADMIAIETFEDMLGASSGEQALKMGIAGAAAAIMSKAGQYAQKFGARTPNPRKQALFNGIEPRTFAFEYTFSPQSLQEAQVIDKIITSFITYSLPSLSSTGAFFKFPCEYRISFHNTQGFPVINWCVCTGVSTNYTPNMMQLVESGHTSQITLSLLFLEADLRTQETPGI